MAVDTVSAARWVGMQLGEVHRGVLPYSGRLLAFGNRGQSEVKSFRSWLRGKGYTASGFAATDDSWVMSVTLPARVRDTRAVLKALWAASPDDPVRKLVQQHIADLQVRLVFARQGLELDQSWFTRREVRELGVLIAPMVSLSDLGVPVRTRPLSLLSLEPSLN